MHHACVVVLQSVHLLSTDMVTAVWRPALHDTLETTHPATVTLVSDITVMVLSVHDNVLGIYIHVASGAYSTNTTVVTAGFSKSSQHATNTRLPRSSCDYLFCSQYTAVPTNYVMSLNATRFYANLSSETPLNSSVFHIQLSINLLAVSRADIIEVTFRFNQNQLVQGLFEFRDGMESNRFVATNYIQNLDDETDVIDATINLVALIYPIDIYLTISVSLLYTVPGPQGFETDFKSAKGVGSIVLASGENLHVRCIDIYCCNVLHVL